MSDQWVVQISPKLADGTLINLRADSAEQAEQLFKWAQENAQGFLRTVAAFTPNEAVQAATTNLQVAGLNPQPVQQAPQQWGQAAQQPEGPRPSCIHGEHKWVPPGTSKNPPYKPYPGFFACPAQRGQQCARS